MIVSLSRGAVGAFAAAGCLVLAVAAPVSANEPAIKHGDLLITAPWTRQPPDGARVAGGYMRITNTGKVSDRLIGGSAPFAKRFEVHEMAMANGVMKMRELANGLEIKPGETVELKPGGYHVMFMDIEARPEAGKTVKTTLKFEKAGEITLDVPVIAPSAGAGSAHKH
jgi:copper(I)-binding protein